MNYCFRETPKKTSLSLALQQKIFRLSGIKHYLRKFADEIRYDGKLSLLKFLTRTKRCQTKNYTYQLTLQFFVSCAIK